MTDKEFLELLKLKYATPRREKEVEFHEAEEVKKDFVRLLKIMRPDKPMWEVIAELGGPAIDGTEGDPNKNSGYPSSIPDEMPTDLAETIDERLEQDMKDSHG